MKFKQTLLLILILMLSTSCGKEKRENAQLTWNTVYVKLGLIYIVEPPKHFAIKTVERVYALGSKTMGKAQEYEAGFTDKQDNRGEDILVRGFESTDKDLQGLSILHHSPNSLIGEILDQKELVHFKFEDASLEALLANGTWESSTATKRPSNLIISLPDNFEADEVYTQDLSDEACRCFKTVWINSDLGEAVYEVIFY